MLRLMGRGYTVEEYLVLIDQLRQARPEIALSTDLIVGFPGETEEDHRRTLELIEAVRFASIFAFKYSPRPGTAAIRLKDAIPLEIAGRRLQEVFSAQEAIQRELNQELVGSREQVLVTGWGRHPGHQTGRTPCHRIVHFPHHEEPVALGTIAPVVIEKALPHSLLGRPVTAL